MRQRAGCAPGWESDPGCLHERGWGGGVKGRGIVMHADRDVPEGGAELVISRIPVVGEFNDGTRPFVRIAQAGEREASLIERPSSYKTHPELADMEVERQPEIAHPQHRVQQARGAADQATHRSTLPRNRMILAPIASCSVSSAKCPASYNSTSALGSSRL